eukprot:scaffold26371_cov117-Cylindrotheca_fusiformis.AAC.3
MASQKDKNVRTPPDKLVQKIRHCGSGFALSGLIRRHPNLFQSIDAVRALVLRVDVLKKGMQKKDISKLTTALSKARVIRASIAVHHKALMHKMAEMALDKVDGFSPKQLSPLICAFARARCQGELCIRLYEKVAKLVVSSCLSEWEEMHLVAIAYAFMKAKHLNIDIFHKIGRELLLRGDAEIFYDGRQLGNLAAAYGSLRCILTPGILELVFHKFQNLHPSETDLQNVVDITSALVLGNELKVVPRGFLDEMASLAIEKAAESRKEDVRGVILNFSKLPIDKKLQRQILICYRPYFHRFSRFMSGANRSKIVQIYKRYGLHSSSEKE